MPKMTEKTIVFKCPRCGAGHNITDFAGDLITDQEELYEWLKEKGMIEVA